MKDTVLPYKIDTAKQAKVLIVYRDFGDGSSHVGLGVNGLHSCRVLRRSGIESNLAGAKQSADISAALKRYSPTHCVIEACWLATAELAKLSAAFHEVQFIVRLHSQVAFLQVEAGAVKLFREGLTLQDDRLNVAMAANSSRFCDGARRAYNGRCLLLPNLYDQDRPFAKVRSHGFGDTIRIGSFGAIRLLKNHATAAAASISIGRRMGKRIEFHINVDRVEHGLGVLKMMRNMYAGLTTAKLIEVPWQSWAEFRHQISAMDLTMQPSCTETFNIVTADSLAEGVPAVVSDSIDWVPPHWRVDSDDPEELARVSMSVLQDHEAGAIGQAALTAYIRASLATWTAYLGGA